MASSVRAELAYDVINTDRSTTSGPTCEATFNEWKKQSGRLSFIYGHILAEKVTKLNRMNISLLAITGASTVITAIQFGFDICEYSSVLLTIQVILTLMAFVATVLSGVITTFKLNEEISDIQRYLDHVEHFYTTMVTDDNLPESLKINREQFIISNKDRWVYTIKNAPFIPLEIFRKASNQYTVFQTERI